MPWVNDDLNKLIEQNWFGEQTTVTIVLGHNLSDIGKGHLTAHIASVLDDRHILKFDSVFLSNYDSKIDNDALVFSRRESPIAIDDFETYKRFNPGLEFSAINSILGGDVDLFFNAFVAGRHSTSNVPDKMKYFAYNILERCSCLGSPKQLLIEIGGTLDSKEVQNYALPTVAYLKHKLTDKCNIVLLNEIGYRGDKNSPVKTSSVKTREIQQAFDICNSYMIQPDMISLRLPSHMPELDSEQREDTEKYVANQLMYRQKTFFDYSENIVTIPFFDIPKVQLGPYLHGRFLELRNNGNSLFEDLVELPGGQ